MELRAIAFVAGETINGIKAVQFPHAGIPGSLGKNGGGSNTQREPVAFNQGDLGKLDAWKNKVICEKVIRE